MPIELIPEALMKSPSAALTVLTSMITPALLLSASGTFIMSTSHRLGRVIDRVRNLTVMMEDIMQEDRKLELLDERRQVIFNMIDRQSARAKLLVRALVVFYVAAGAFVATSVCIGIISLYGPKLAWLPLALGITGAILMFIGSMILIYEARLAVVSLHLETRFLDKLVDFHYRQRLTGV
jgi:Protein of unknown function (DUF2721)